MMREQTAVQAIDALAAKLSVPATHLWSVLTAQAKIEAFQILAWLMIVPVLWLVWWRVLQWIKANEDDWDAGAEMFGVIGGIALCVASVVVLVGATSAVGYLVNPEYYALKQVLEVLK